MSTLEKTPDRAADPKQALLDGLGGVSGMVYTALPVAVFVAANAFFPLPVTIGIAVLAALLLTGWRKLRGERLMSAAGGLFGVLAAGGVAAWTGSANGFFLIGIWAAFGGAVVMLASLLVRRPLTGVVWNLVHGGKHVWRADRPSLRAHDLATLAVTLVFAARFVVKQWLYVEDATGWLAFTKIAMGAPLTALAAVVVLWAFRRCSTRLTGATAAAGR
ncbi:DUF3159 domain-containing protein [Sciscionella sediminilitoris]|uniref:DUF3159 domain-containing protein n=1 Tax=Sciscionella sediminilitoris TaxID=1445613 RepID=UPI0004DFC5D1|nr:DUF3159 domain-containing protein [Sciscionella sp. SE31]